MAERRANGEGNIRKRKDGRWEGRCTADHDPETGKIIYKNVLGKTQSEVKEKLKQAIEENGKIDVTKAEQYTVGQWMDIWFENCAKIKVRPSSHQTYRGYILTGNRRGRNSPGAETESQRRQRSCVPIPDRRADLPGQRSAYAPLNFETGRSVHKVCFHDMRHTFATLALQNGVGIKTVSEMLGHYSAGFTLDTYAHVTTAAQREAAKTMGHVLSGAVQHFPGVSTYGSAFGSTRKRKNQHRKKVMKSKEDPRISNEIRGSMVAGAGFEPTTSGL